MGQYYKAVNLDKKEFMHPHACGDGAKLMEFALSSMSMMSCLAILLADGNGRGGGDLFGVPCKACGGSSLANECKSCNGDRYEPLPKIVGSWAGDRIVIAGDYADSGKFIPPEYVPREWDADKDGRITVYNLAHEDNGWKDVSLEAMTALAMDKFVRKEFIERSDESKWQRDQYSAILKGDS